MKDSWADDALPASSENSDARPLYIVHIALQGCVKSGEIDYGLTADTGGHIRYLLEEVRALHSAGVRQSVVTRAFADPGLGAAYRQTRETLIPGVVLHRLWGDCPDYLAKEDIHQDLDALADGMVAWLEGLPCRPDLLHAHYADAGVLALRIRERLGIPFLFTAHSLGAVKAQWLESPPSCDDSASASMRRRIAAEQAVIAQADLIVASSEDEAKRQYGLYSRDDAARPISINPPGCALERFARPVSSERVESLLQAALADPGKPILLCLARPVRRKNLLGVIDAYGQDAALHSRANLVIFAGTRRANADQEPECRDLLQALVDRIDHYDLHGRVALPTHHLAEEVPAIYQHAARSGGLFINAAFHEPFGLTLVEAAAAGLPVIATCNGGARNIVERCDSGILVDPRDGAALVRAAHRLLDDADLWQHHAQSGQAGAHHYSWQRHVQQYLRDCSRVTRAPSRIAKPRRAVSRTPARATHLLVTDMDDTLLGDAAGLEEFTRWLKDHPHVRYAVATGRAAADAWAELVRWRAPLPDVLISSVGAEVHWPASVANGSIHGQSIVAPVLDVFWTDTLTARWQVQRCADVLSNCLFLQRQPAGTQRTNKLAYTTTAGPAVVVWTQRRLAEAGLAAEVVYSHGRFVDVLAPGGGKGSAAEYVASELSVAASNVIGAGNSGNDVDLLKRAACGIAVGNCDADLLELAASPTVYFARSSRAAGLVEGLHYWLHRIKLAARAG